MHTVATPLVVLPPDSSSGSSGLPRLPRVVPVERTGAVLHPAPQAGEHVMGLNLTRGCAMRCGFCSVRASPSYPGDEVVYLYRGTALQLGAELAARPHKPRAVYVCPATDPFPPLSEVQAETVRVIATLAAHNVPAWLMTRGHIRAAAREALAAHARHVRVIVPLTTTQRGLQRVLEPWTASPRMRLRQIAALRRMGVTVQVSLEPLIPNVTDTPENLTPLFRALASAGVSHVNAGYLFLRAGIEEQLSEVFEQFGGIEALTEEYHGGPLLSGPGLAAARYLPRARRQRGYASLMSLAAAHGITVSVSRATNPDFADPAPATSSPRQRLLPLYLQQVH